MRLGRVNHGGLWNIWSADLALSASGLLRDSWGAWWRTLYSEWKCRYSITPSSYLKLEVFFTSIHQRLWDVRTIYSTQAGFTGVNT